jgi:hypothetical protein
MDNPESELGISQLCQKGFGGLKAKTPAQAFKRIEVRTQGMI